MNGAQAILKTLQEENVKHSFGVTGGSVIPLFDEHYKDNHDLRHILARHEQGAAHAAEGYARASGKPGVCIATSGPGATNLVTGIMDAYMDSTPIIAFGGQVHTHLIGNDAFQESDMIGITKPITKANFQVRSADEMRSTIKKAFRTAVSGKPGPVYIDLPKDTQINEVKNEVPFKEPSFEIPSPSGDKIRQAAELILNAERPVMLAGGGAISANAGPEIAEFAEAFSIPVVTTIMGKSVFPENHPLALGVLGMHGRKCANYAIVNADVVLAIGSRFNDRITGKLSTFLESAKLIHIDIDSKEHGKNVKYDVDLHGNAKLVMSRLLAFAKKTAASGKTNWGEKIKGLAKECNCSIDIEASPIDPRRVMHELGGFLREDDIVTTGVGQHQMFAAHFLKRTRPRTFITSGGAGTMGYGFPASLGAKVAKPESEVINVDGDGSFGMVVQELGMAKQEEIKVIPVIMNNSYLGMVRQWLELFYDKRYSAVKFGNIPDFAKIAEAYGLEGIRVSRDSEIRPALEEARKNDATTVIDVQIAEESNIIPMFRAGDSVHEMFGPCIPEGYFKKVLR